MQKSTCHGFTLIGIETSCDETGVALYSEKNGLIGHVVHSQVASHARFGGVVPELASRDHVRKAAQLVKTLLKESSLCVTDIDAVAYTAGPGLMGALLVGATVGTGLAMSINRPAIAVHHMEGHLVAAQLEHQSPGYPYIALLVSGGHTQLIAVRGYRSYELLGESLDDAAGEAFDKAAKMLELPYPGGPNLAALADRVQNPSLKFPRPMVGKPGLDFSFSGLKTHTRTTIESMQQRDGALSDEQRAEIAAAFQAAVVDTLFIKCRRAVEQTGIQRLVLAGGVAANRSLRAKLQTLTDVACFYPSIEYCTDNGAMIAYAGYLCYKHQGEACLDWRYEVQVKPRWPLVAL